ncbi:hypothetical protein FRB99_003969, partial [Tulasnella sp. 403]
MSETPSEPQHDTATSDVVTSQENTRDASTSVPQSMGTSPQDLTPLRAHYLKKSLISLQFAKELKVLSNPPANPNVSILSYLGQPFTPPPKDAGTIPDLLFFRFISRQFFLTFPFFASAPKNFFPQKLQPFVDSLLTRNLTGGHDATLHGSQEAAEELTRQKVIAKLEKQLSLLLGTAIKLAEKEEVVRLTQSDLDRLEALAKRRREKASKEVKDVFEINVIGVRSVVERRNLRSRTHDEFIIRTRRTGQPDMFVARRFGDFKTLWETLRKKHPEEEVPTPPTKDRSATMATSTSGYGMSEPPSPAPYPLASTTLSRSETSLSGTPSLARSSTMMSSTSASQFRLSREKNRLSLR